MLNFVPGPVCPNTNTLDTYRHFPGSPALCDNFFHDYNTLITHLQTICQTNNQFAIMTGEGMLALWATMKSSIQPGDKVLVIINGLYGNGLASIAEGLGANVTRLLFSDTDFDLGALMQATENMEPDMICCVHCETPTGLLNPLNQIATVKKDFAVPLLLVDAISSIGATPVNMDANHVDLLCGSAPKALGALSDISFVGVSDAGWHAILKKNYRLGYDALAPFKDIKEYFDFPYMPHWPGIQALKIACENLLEAGLSKIYERHIEAQTLTIETLESHGFEMLQNQPSLRSPSVTAIHLPPGHSWYKFNALLVAKGLQVGRGMLPEHRDRLFRIGHMGPQANIESLKQALSIITETIVV